MNAKSEAIRTFAAAEWEKCHAVLDDIGVARGDNGEPLSLSQRLELHREAMRAMNAQMKRVHLLVLSQNLAMGQG